MAGVSLAWLLDSSCDVVLLEARDSIGGNVQSVEVHLDGQAFVVDIGAQYFHPGPYPLYTALLTELGLYPPAASGPGTSHAFPASITLSAGGEATPRFVSPVLPQRGWPLFATWNQPALAAFGLAFGAAQRREQLGESWMLTMEDWLPTLGLPREQWERTVLPWAASLFSGDIDETRGLSARAAMIFAAKALPPNPLDPILYYVLSRGMIEVLERLLDQCSTVTVLTNAPVQHVSRGVDGTFTIVAAGNQTLTVDDLVFASPGPVTLTLLEGLTGTSAQQAALRGVDFREARLALHTEPSYAPSSPLIWSFLNSGEHGAFCEASMWLAPVLKGVPIGTAAKLWKSWVTHRDQPPGGVVHEAAFNHMLPTPATIFAQGVLRILQGQGGIWFAGGYTRPYDSQETALRSALGVALGLKIRTARGEALRAAGVEPELR
jgi:uncharacterized protein